MPVVFLVVAVALLVSLCVFATTESLVLAAVAYLSVGMFVSGLVMSLVAWRLNKAVQGGEQCL